VAAIPGREQEFAAQFRQALEYVTAIGGCQIHCFNFAGSESIADPML
jgi:hydroxypyruvate isomerase